MIKTTQKHFEYYKYICEQWLKVFELSDWEVYYKLGDTEGSLAFVKFDFQAQLVACHFCDEWSDALKPFSWEEIAKSAKHEMLHGLLAEITELGASRYINHDQLERAEEGLVHKLTKLIPDSHIEDNFDVIRGTEVEINEQSGDQEEIT